MKKKSRIIVALTLLCATLAQGELEAEVDGVVPGAWTMDLEAAKKMAVEKELPIMLNFTGSDWCGWCILMENQVFNKEAWSEYAKDHVLMVMLDYPSDKSRVPEKYHARNAALQEKYAVNSFPTYVVISPDGKHELGRMEAGKEKTPASVKTEFEELLLYSDIGVKAYCESLGEREGAEYATLHKELRVKEAESVKAILKADLAEIESNSAKGLIVRQKKKMAAFRISQMSEEKHAEYAALAKSLADARAGYATWRKEHPEKNAGNTEIQKTFSAKILGIIKEMDKF